MIRRSAILILASLAVFSLSAAASDLSLDITIDSPQEESPAEAGLSSV